MVSKSKEDVIKEKIELIEKKTGNKVKIEESSNIPHRTIIDFPNWNDMSQLPLVLYEKNVDRVHILHELIHLEKFFLEEYAVIVHKDKSFSKIDEVFKNIPENYVAHKVIKYQHGFDPIDKSWFKKENDKLQGRTDEEIAAKLIDFWAFTEFCPEYKKERRRFSKNCQMRNPKAFDMANRGIKSLKKMDHLDPHSYNCSAKEIIDTFAPIHLKNKQIFLAYLSRSAGKWRYIPDYEIRGRWDLEVRSEK